MARAHAQSGEMVRLASYGVQLGEHQTTAILKAEELELVRLVEVLRDAPRHVLQVARLPDAKGRLTAPAGLPSAALVEAARGWAGLMLRV